MRKTLYIHAFLVGILLFGSQTVPIHAQQNAETSGSVNPSSGFQIQNPLNVDSVCGLIKKILAFILAVGMPIAALFLAYAGFMFITARGNTTKITAARTNLINVFLGLFIFIGAWLLGQVIANTLKNISPSNAASVSSCN